MNIYFYLKILYKVTKKDWAVIINTMKKPFLHCYLSLNIVTSPHEFIKTKYNGF